MDGSLRPRKYQLEAARWALSRRRATICMPTGTGKTLVAGLWIRGLPKGASERVLVLEPTRFLVEQVARFFRERMRLDAAPLHGSLPRVLRERAERARIIVATPEIVVHLFREGRMNPGSFSALVVDECHHTTGKDAYVEAVRHLAHVEYRLGLSAFIPRSRASHIESWIGDIRCWGWDHPNLRPYIPEWIGEVYEAPFNPHEGRLYKGLEKLWEQASGSSRMLLGMALRWMARDGVDALRESVTNSHRLRELVEPLEKLMWSPSIRPAHKWGSLERILEDHDPFTKAIVFIDRIVIARRVAELLSSQGFETTLLLGRRRAPKQSLDRARNPRTRIIVSTSAGEEGIDLPEADLLIVWSNTASPLRLVQRVGRLLRARDVKGGPKWAVFIVTPETVDVDSLLDGVVAARAAGVDMSIDEETISHLLELSRRRRILELLEKDPLPEEVLARALSAPPEKLKPHLRWLQSHGIVSYIYTPFGRVYFLPDQALLLRSKYSAFLTPPQTRQEVTIVCKNSGNLLRRAPPQMLEQLLERSFKKRRQCNGVKISVMTWRGPSVFLKNFSYEFPVWSLELLRVLVDNARAMAAVS